MSEGAVQVGPDRSLGLVEQVGDLGERQVFVEAQDHDDPLSMRQSPQLFPGLVDLGLMRDGIGRRRRPESGSDAGATPWPG